MSESKSNSDSNTNANTNANANDLTAYERDKKTQAQVEAIQEEIKASSSLVGNPSSLSDLSQTCNFHEESHFYKGCTYLSTKYDSYRPVRRDGNCYYRAFLYALAEELLLRLLNEQGKEQQDGNEQEQKDDESYEFERIQTYVKESIDHVTQFGYDRFTIEMFHDEFMELLSSLDTKTGTGTTTTATATTTTITRQQLHDKLNEENSTSDYCTWYLRVITSAYLKKDASRFIHFLDDPNYFDVATFCAREVDPMGRECGMVQVLALAEAFGVTVHIEYLDGKELPLIDGEQRLIKHSFSPPNDSTSGTRSSGSDSNSGVEITLLFRPGHYDILYAK